MLGIVFPGQVKKEVTTSSGSIRVNSEKCFSCPFRAGSSFNPQLKRILDRLEKFPEEGMLCHNTYPEDVLGATCRGAFDTRTMFEGEKIEFVDQPISQFLVIPY